MSEDVIDPVRKTLKNILDLTGTLVRQLREAGEGKQAKSLIVCGSYMFAYNPNKETKAL